MKTLLVLSLLLLASCGGGLVPKKYPERDRSQMFYTFDDNFPQVYSIYCEKNDDDNCKVDNVDIQTSWNFFRDGNFIIIPESYIFK